MMDRYHTREPNASTLHVPSEILEISSDWLSSWEGTYLDTSRAPADYDEGKQLPALLRWVYADTMRL